MLFPRYISLHFAGWYRRLKGSLLFYVIVCVYRFNELCHMVETLFILLCIVHSM